MTTTETPAAATAAPLPTLPELIATQLNSMHVIAGRLVKLAATPGGEGVTLSISHPFPPRSHMQVQLRISYPDDVTDAEILDGAVEIGAAEDTEIQATTT